MTTVAFDVDHTLIIPDYLVERGDTGFDVPRYENIELFWHFHRLGCEMFIWSGGGVDYATRWAEKLGLPAKIREKGSFVPDISIDDERVSLGRINLCVTKQPDEAADPA